MWKRFACTIVCLHTLVQLATSIIPHQLTDKELIHLFGTVNRDKLPFYWLDHPVRHHSANAHTFSINIDGQPYVFDIEENNLLSPDFHQITRYGNHSVMEDDASRPCIWRGHATSHNNTRRGMVSTESGHYLIQPVPDSHARQLRHARQVVDSHPHVIHKRDAPRFHVLDKHVKEIDDTDDPMVKPCLFDARDDPFPPDDMDSFRDRVLDRLGVVKSWPDRLAVHTGSPLIIELAVFADDAMWDHFRDIYDDNADAEMQKFILTACNNIDHLFDHSSLEPHVRLRIVRYEAMKTAPSNLRRTAHNDGEVDLLLEKFCEYQNQINPASDSDSRHWDHALLFSGYDLYRGHLKSVAGYAPVKGMCSATRSCTINEGLDFGAVFVITHEMGHSLGMYHDGDNGCDSRCCVMSPSVGAGKTQWSQCSVNEFNEFLDKLGSPLQPANCLLDGDIGRASIDHAREGKKPGQVYTLHQQCRIFHGDCWSHELRDGQSLSDVCEMVWCGGGEGIIRTSHPALEGTYCGTGRWCEEGKCRGWSSSPQPVVHGSWSSWDDSPSASCGADCSECAVAGQMKVKRSIRLCETPAPNNGGRDCPGSNVRGLLCSKSKCSGSSPDDFATQQCTKLRSDADTPDLQLSGKGFQYEQSPCKVWCHMQTSGFIRTVGNFPDGTPCGTSSYCVKGQCLKLACNGNAIVESTSTDCPSEDAVQKESGEESSRSWAEWSDWTLCSSTCGRGVRQRVRSCQGRVCLGTSRQRDSCEEKTCPLSNEWSDWASWSVCDVRCGTGRQSRNRECDGNVCVGSSVQIRQCKADDCESIFSNGNDDQTWSTWASWSQCSRTCDAGVQIRRRSCNSRICTGRSSQSRSCQSLSCDARTSSGSDSERSDWQQWSSWTTCTRSCGSGTRFRKRKCDGESVCYGSSIEFGTCSQQSCGISALDIFRRAGDQPVRDTEEDSKPDWLSWEAWGECSQSCGGGFRRRVRECSHRTGCQGLTSTTRSCNNIACSVFESSSSSESRNRRSGGIWSLWGAWTSCHCRARTQRRYRRCIDQPPCRGSWSEQRSCVPSPLC